MSAALRDRLLIPAVALVVGWTVGYLARPLADRSPAPLLPITPVPLTAASASDSVEATAPRDARTALGIALQNPLGLQRRRDLIDAISRLSATEIPSLVKTARHFPYDDREEVLRLLGARWAELDPVAVMTFALQSEDVADARGLGFAAMSVWCQRDQAAAMA